MSSDKKLLVIEPGVKLNGDAYRKLEEAGYVIVRGDPAQFHVIGDVGDTILLECALKGIEKSSVASDEFGKQVTAYVLRRRRPTNTTLAAPTNDAARRPESVKRVQADVVPLASAELDSRQRAVP